MEQTLKFTKKDTLAVKGIAISFLLAYHLFSRTSRMRGYDVSFWPLPQNVAMGISLCMVHCVGMFAFLSVYGLTRSLKREYAGLDFNGHEATVFVLKRYVKLVLMFVLPFLFCTGVTFLTDSSHYSGTKWQNLISLGMDFFGVGHLFDTEMLVSTWWFLSLEVLLIIFLPFAVRMYRKYSWLSVIMVIVPGIMISNGRLHLIKYLLVVPLAVCFADQDVLERLKQYKVAKNPVLNKVLKFVISTVVLLGLVLLWYQAWGREHFEFVLNGLIPMTVIYWLYEFVLDIPGIRQILEFLGTHSANVFYVHSFLRTIWIKKVVYSFGNAALIWLFLMGVSVLISLLLELVKKVIRYGKISAWITDGIVGWADRTLRFSRSE